MAAFSASAKAFTLSLPEDIRYSVKLGYNIGGTAPLGIPATIRKMNRYKMQSNYSLAFDMQKQIKGRWGAMTGIKLENKGMEVDATVKNYHMSMVKGSSRLTGYYTGNTVIKAEEWALTLPIQATYTPAKNVLVRLGPYVSYVTSRKFDGYVYSGYLRENTPTGAKILMGDSESEGQRSTSATTCATGSLASTPGSTGMCISAGVSTPTFHGASQTYSRRGSTPLNRSFTPFMELLG